MMMICSSSRPPAKQHGTIFPCYYPLIALWSYDMLDDFERNTMDSIATCNTVTPSFLNVIFDRSWLTSCDCFSHDVDHLLHHCTDRFKSDSSAYSASSSTTAADKFYSIRVWYTLHHHDIHRASILSSFYLLPLMLSFRYRVQVFWRFSYVFSPIEHMPATQIDDEIS